MALFSPSRPSNIGILAAELYLPRAYVSLAALEKWESVSIGKYTLGLGQERMAVPDACEDVNALCLSALSALIRRSKLDLLQVGFLAVGSESLVDRSKSTKSVLMRLFAEAGNYEVEGIDLKQACYGATAAVFHALDWLESSAWDGRYALVVAADIAVYPRGPARPTGGCGAVALLLGPDAPLAIESWRRATYMQHDWDFYKADPRSEYPQVDGRLSVNCYQNSLLTALDSLRRKWRSARHPLAPVALASSFAEKSSANAEPVEPELDLSRFRAILCHSPFTRLVHKAFGLLLLHDALKSLDVESTGASASKCAHQQSEPNSVDADAERAAFLQFCARVRHCWHPTENEKLELTADQMRELLALPYVDRDWRRRGEPGIRLARNTGNMYTASLYGSLLSFLYAIAEENGSFDKTAEQLEGERVLLYSFGSGTAASLFSVRLRSPQQLAVLLAQVHANLSPLLAADGDRYELSPEQFEQRMSERERDFGCASWKPAESSRDSLRPGCYYLCHIDEAFRRHYQQHSDRERVTDAK